MKKLKGDIDQRLFSFWLCVSCGVKIRANAVPSHKDKGHLIEHYNYDPRPVLKKK